MSPPNKNGLGLGSMHSLVQDTNVSSYDQILMQGMTKKLLDELAMTAVRVNYGQTPRSVHAFVGTTAYYSQSTATDLSIRILRRSDLD